MLSTLLTLHIAGGSVALASMVVPLVSRKGGRLHRLSGWIFVAGMATVSLTAFVLSAARALDGAHPLARQNGLFLFYIALLTAAGVSAGVRVLRFKTRQACHRHWWDLLLPALLVAAALGMLGYGLATGRVLFSAFSAVGLLTGGSQLLYWLRPPAHRMHWWFEHMGAMLGSCIAATTAFLVVNAGRLGAETFGLLVWLAPTLVGVPVTLTWTAYYRRRFGAS